MRKTIQLIVVLAVTSLVSVGSVSAQDIPLGDLGAQATLYQPNAPARF